MENLTNITFGEWLNIWFDTYKKPNLKPYSLRNIEQQIRLHTPEWLKNMVLKDITLFDIDKALSSMKPSRTLVYTRQVWHNAFEKAVRVGIVSKNVCDHTEKIRYKKKKSNALSIAEQDELFARLESSRIKYLVLFYIFTGVRRAEATNLLWSDINFQEGTILIRGTKTEKSDRTILLSPDVEKILNGQRKQIEADKGTRFESKSPEKVFDYSPCYISQAFKKLCPKHHLHDLRHTFITRCAESEMNVAVCQQLVGHSTINMTMDIYTHVFDDFKRSEAMKFKIGSKGFVL